MIAVTAAESRTDQIRLVFADRQSPSGKTLLGEIVDQIEVIDSRSVWGLVVLPSRASRVALLKGKRLRDGRVDRQWG